MSERLSNALFADLYELTMAQAYWQHARQGQATFSMYFREYPPDRGYLVFAGLQDLLDNLEDLHFTEADVAHLGSTGQFDDAFLDALKHFRFTGTVRAMTEGEIFFVDEPVVEVTGPIIEAQLVETYLMNQINLQTTLATKAARVVHAAQGRSLVEFAARRTQGTDAAIKLARVSYLVGFAGTSNVLAGGLYGMPTFGTMAHSFISSYPAEREAFADYASSFPDATTLLVDTYDTLRGTRNAIEVARELEQAGHRLRSIRLDSGDLHELSLACRKLLDEARLGYVEVFASGGLDELQIDELLRAGAPIDGFGVGTKLGVSGDAPWTDCAYKLVEYDGEPVLKLSTGKQTLPGRKQVFRSVGTEGSYRGDLIAVAGEEPPSGAWPLLREVMHDGRRTVPSPSLVELRERFAAEFACLPEQHKALRSPERYNVELSETLSELQARVRRQVVERELG